MTKTNKTVFDLRCAEMTYNIAYGQFERDCKLYVMLILLIFLVGFACSCTFMLLPSLAD